MSALNGGTFNGGEGSDGVSTLDGGTFNGGAGKTSWATREAGRSTAAKATTA